MRPLEIVQLATAGVAVVVAFTGGLRNRAAARLVWALTGLAALIQVASEGPRWQLVPAYALAAGFLVAWLLSLPTVRTPRPGPAGTAAGIALLLVVLAASVALPVALPVFGFPSPRGPYGIGTVTYHWTQDRPEPFTAERGDRRQLMAQVWYPAARHAPGPRAPYVQDAAAVTPAVARLSGFPPFLLSHFRHVTTNAVPSAPAAGGRFPVLVYLTGLDGFRSVNTFQVESLVARGYVVVGLDQPGVSAAVRFPNGRVITGRSPDRMGPLLDQSTRPRTPAPTLGGRPLPRGSAPYLAADVPAALDRLATLNRSDRRLAGHLDLSRAGVFGISIGGMNAAEACRTEPRLKACLVMDSAVPADVVRDGLRQPALMLTRDAATMRREGLTADAAGRTLNSNRAVYRSGPGPGYLVQIPGMYHADFTDIPSWSPAARLTGMSGPYGGRRGHDTVTAYTRAFFDTHLRGHASPLLNGPSPRFPGVRVQARR